MKHVLFGIFAHPDDEAFGPAGTLLKLKDNGYDIHLILLTDGDAGVNIDDVPDIAGTRLAEWQASADILGASSTHALHYPDGALETVNASELEEKVTQIITETINGSPETSEVSLMTFEPNGITGHRDHIAVSKLTARLVSRLKIHDVWYFCLDSTQAPLKDTAYYKPQAREATYITHKIDVSAYMPTIYRMIDAHVSQRVDGANRKALGQERLSIECFRIEG